MSTALAASLIGVATAIMVALIGAWVSIRGKRLDHRAAVDERHAAARESAYDLILTAGDAFWNFITRNYVSEVADGAPLPEEEKKRFVTRCDELLIQGQDRLEAHAADMTAVRRVLEAFCRTIFFNSDGSAEQYERARETIVDCRRHDSGLRRLYAERPARGWRQLIPTRTMRAWRRRLREASAKPTYRGVEVEQLIQTVDGITMVGVSDGDAWAALVDEQRNWERGMLAGVATTEARLAYWRKVGTWND